MTRAALLTAQGVGVTLGGRAVLRDVSLSLSSGHLVALVVAVEAPVMLADEPTTSLDPRYQIDAMTNLRNAANGGMLVIVVTHDLGLAARFADMVLVLSEGRLVAQGAPAEAFSERVM